MLDRQKSTGTVEEGDAMPVDELIVLEHYDGSIPIIGIDSTRITDIASSLSERAHRLHLPFFTEFKKASLIHRIHIIFEGKSIEGFTSIAEKIFFIVNESKEVTDYKTLKAYLLTKHPFTEEQIEYLFKDINIVELDTVILEIIGVESLEPFSPAYDEASNAMTKALDKKRVQKEEKERLLLEIARKLKLFIKEKFEIDPSTTKLKSILTGIVSEELDKPMSERTPFHLLVLQIIRRILMSINLVLSESIDLDTYSQLREIAIEIIFKFKLTDPNYNFALEADNIRFDLEGINFNTSWALRRSDPYSQGKKKLPINLKELRKKGVNEYDPIYSLGTLLKAEKKTRESIFQLASKISKKILTADQLSNKIMHEEDIDLIVAILMKPTTCQTDFNLKQLAFARLSIIHASVLISTGYSEELAAEATSAILRKFNSVPFVFSFNAENYFGDNQSIHQYDFRSIGENSVTGKVYIGAPKLAEACGLKIILNPPRNNVTDVIYDACRATITISDEEWDKGEEHILAIVKIVIAHFIPVLGTDVIYDRTKIAIKLGDQTKSSSSGKSRRVNVTFLNKHSTLSRGMTSHKQGSFELQIVPESEFKVPKDHPDYEKITSERKTFEENRNLQGQSKLGFSTEFESYFISLLSHTVFISIYNGVQSPDVVNKVRAVAQEVNRITGNNSVQDPATNVLNEAIEIINGVDNQLIHELIINMIISNTDNIYLIVEFRQILIAVYKAMNESERKSNVGTKLLNAINFIATAYNDAVSRIRANSTDL